MDNFCQKIKANLKNHLPAHSYNMWIDPLSIYESEQNGVIVGCKNGFFKKRILANYAELIKTAVYETCDNSELSIEFSESAEKVEKTAKKKVENKKVIKPSAIERKKFGSEKSQLSLPLGRSRFENGRFLRKGFTLDNFIVGQNSEFAYSAALSLVSGRGTGYNSVFVQADTGLGKSHLSQAVGHHILSESPCESVYYVSAEDFTNEMVSSLRQDKIGEFKERYRRKCDVLLMDDVHFLTGKPRTQQELSMILDYLMEADKKIIFSSCHNPNEIPKLNDQLRSRLSSSLISKIDKPDFKTRRKIAKRKSVMNGYDLSEDIIDYLASELTENIRQLESGVHTLGVRSSLFGTPMTYKFAQEILSEISEKSRDITIESIKKLVAGEFGLSIDHLVSKSRKRAIVKPRQIAIFLSRKYTDQPLQKIGKSFNRYHATAIHAIKTVEDGIKTKNSIFKQVELLKTKLENGDF